MIMPVITTPTTRGSANTPTPNFADSAVLKESSSRARDADPRAGRAGPGRAEQVRKPHPARRPAVQRLQPRRPPQQARPRPSARTLNRTDARAHASERTKRSHGRTQAHARSHPRTHTPYYTRERIRTQTDARAHARTHCHARRQHVKDIQQAVDQSPAAFPKPVQCE
jgi:hypothetical protein